MQYKKLVKPYNGIIDSIIKEIKKSGTIAIIGHVDPDCDSIGSQLALYKTFTAEGWNADLINEGPFDNINIGEDKKLFKKTIDIDYDLYLIVDTPAADRMGKVSNKVDFKKSIVIDHHYTNTGYCRINWVDDNFISTAEMIYLILERMNIGLDKKDVCQHLLNGVTSDNGYFKHVRIEKAFSLLVSYLLIKKGADPRISYNNMFGQKSLSSKKLLALALNRLESLAGGRILWTYITEGDKQGHNNAMADSAAVFNDMMSVDKTDVGIYFKVLKDKIDISFRSNDKVDVSELAQYFGGGGHKAASGTTVKGDFENIRKEVLNKAVELLKKSN